MTSSFRAVRQLRLAHPARRDTPACDVRHVTGVSPRSCHFGAARSVPRMGAIRHEGEAMRELPTVRRLVRPDPDDRWAAVFGRIAVYSFLMALVSGILLLPFFQSSMTPVGYHGSYRELDGLTVSRAYQSTLNISFDLRGGLLIRQVHHWSADLFVAAVCLRLIRVFFRGRFRLPDWLIWVGLLLASMLAGFSGAILPDDMLSGGSLSVFI